MIIFSNIPPHARCGGAHSSERLGFRRHGMTRAAPVEKKLLGPPLQWKASPEFPTLLIPQLALFLHPLIQGQML